LNVCIDKKTEIPQQYACGGRSCLLGQLTHVVRTLSSDVLELHESVRRLRPDTALVRVQNAVWMVAGVLVGAVSCTWLYDRVLK
jgi:hypothetical protein